MPKYQRDVLLTALREGTRPAAIAAYFGDQGWLNVSEKSFVQYIQAFKRTYPEMIGTNDDEKHMDHYVDPRQPGIDEEQVLEQMIRVQKARIGVGMKFERDTSIVNQHLHKDINATVAMVELLAKMRGKMIGAGRPTADSHHPMSTEAKEGLRQATEGEHQQTKIVNMFERLGKLMKQKQDAA